MRVLPVAAREVDSRPVRAARRDDAGPLDLRPDGQPRRRPGAALTGPGPDGGRALHHPGPGRRRKRRTGPIKRPRLLEEEVLPIHGELSENLLPIYGELAAKPPEGPSPAKLAEKWRRTRC